MQKLVRLGPVMRGQCRTVYAMGDGVEILDTVEVHVASWKSSGSAQRWLSVSIRSGPQNGLELYIPLEALTGELRTTLPLDSSPLIE